MVLLRRHKRWSNQEHLIMHTLVHCRWARTAFGAAWLSCAALAAAHGFVAGRFFPPTIATDDPFATDELSLPTVSIVNNSAGGGSPETQVIDTGFEFDKEIFPRFAIGIADDYISQKPSGQPTAAGWDNLVLSGKWQFWQNDAHEAVLAVGLIASLGDTGSRAINDSTTVLTPTLYGGKGFGDLPDQLAPLQPLAVTGTLGEDFPLRANDPNALELGVAVEYSLLYLEQHVQDTGMPRPWRDMIPLVEFTMTDPQNRDAKGQVIATAYPGVLWETPYFQLGAEAVVPLNSRSGVRVGAVVNLQIYIDDIFPNVFGHPLFGEE
jgi:hypothetical protein